MLRNLARARALGSLAAPLRAASSSSSVAPHLVTKRADYLLGFEKHSTARDFFHKTSYAIVAGVPLALICGGPVASVINVACGVVIPLHAHIGMRSVILDYVHVVPQQRVVLAGLAVFTAGSALGLTYFNLYDVGLTEGIKALWIKQHPM